MKGDALMSSNKIVREFTKDVNDLQKSDNYSLDYFNKCFSDNELDVIMI